MREIKFRAWDKTFSKMYLPIGDTSWDSDEHCIKFGVDSPCENMDGEVILMQYTGLKDKNGKEIYEGDILEHEYSEVSLLKVVFARGGFNVVGINLDEPLSELLSPDNGLYRQSKVIGNIYENPELLGGTDGRD